MSQGPPWEISGSVVVAADIDSFNAARLGVFLEDVTLQDVSATIIDQQVIANITHTSGTEHRYAFRLAIRHHIDERASYAVRAHIDVQGDGEISVGDYITMQSYPVLTFGHPTTDLSLAVHNVV